MNNKSLKYSFSIESYINQKLDSKLIKILNDNPDVILEYKSSSLIGLPKDKYLCNFEFSKNKNRVELKNIFGKGRLNQLINILNHFGISNEKVKIIKVPSDQLNKVDLDVLEFSHVIICFDIEIIVEILSRQSYKNDTPSNLLNYRILNKDDTNIILFDLAYFYGEGIKPLLKLVSRINPVSVLFFGNCGGIGNDINIGSLLIPTKLMKETGTKNIENKFFGNNAYTGSPPLSINNCVAVTLDNIFHNTIKNTSYYKRLKTIVSVDLENKYIFDELEHKQIRLYSILEVTDLPGHKDLSGIGDISKSKERRLHKENIKYILKYFLKEINYLKHIYKENVDFKINSPKLLHDVHHIKKMLSEKVIKKGSVIGLGGFAGSGKTHYLTPLIKKHLKEKALKQLSIEGDRFVIPFEKRNYTKFPYGFYNYRGLLKCIDSFINSKYMYVPLFDPIKHCTPTYENKDPNKPHSDVGYFDLDIKLHPDLKALMGDSTSELAVNRKTDEIFEKINPALFDVLLIDLAYINNIREIRKILTLSIFSFSSENTRITNLLESKSTNLRFQTLDNRQVRKKFEFWKLNHDKYIWQGINLSDYIFINEDV